MRLTRFSAKLAATMVLALLIPPPLFSQSRPPGPPRKSQPQVQQIAVAIGELLKERPLWPDSAENENGEADKHAPKAEKKPPADDAPIYDLITYWRDHGYTETTKPSDKVRERLLAACEDRPSLLSRLMFVLPQTPDTQDRLYKLLIEDPDENAPWKNMVRQWLKFNSSYFRENLIEEVRSLSQNNSMDISAVNALAQLDWDAARPMVETMAGSSNPYRAAQSLGLIYEQAARSNDSTQAESLRARLKAMVSNRQTPVSIRQSAFQSLMATEWSGQEEWYLSLFTDTSLSGAQFEEKLEEKDKTKSGAVPAATRGKIDWGRLSEDGTGFNFLWLPLQQNADKWVPIVTRMIGNNDRAVHLAAVSCLAEFLATGVSAKETSRQAARALLPWLTDPNWGGRLERWTYLGSLSEMDLPEAMSGLIWILDNDETAEGRAIAAEALIHYHNPQAVPPLRRALLRENNEQLREAIIIPVIKLGGFSDDEAVTAIEAYARKAATDEGQTEIAAIMGGDSDKSLPLQVSIGRAYDDNEEIIISETLAAKLFERAKALRATQPAVARKILSIADNADTIIADLSLVDRISEGWVDVDAVKLALGARNSMRKRVGAELFKVFKQGGYAAGLAAILLDDENNQLELLKSKDQNAQLALLAAARYTREKLPVEAVSKLFAVPALAAAAESYLEIEDSAEARKLVWARHVGEAKILGEGFNVIVPPASSPVSKWEEKMRTEVRGTAGTPAPEEIYALVPSYNPGLNGSILIRAQKGKAEISVQNEEGRRRARLLTESEWQDFKQFVAQEEVENLGPQNRQPAGEFAIEEMRFEYLRLTKDGGRRIMTIAPGRAPKTNATLYEQLAAKFYQLSHSGEFKLRYLMEDKIPGLEVLLADDKRKVFTVCQDGSQTRQLAVMVEPERTDLAGAAPNPVARLQPFSGFEWRAFAAGQLGQLIEEPRACQFQNLAINAQDWLREIRNRSGVILDWHNKVGETWFAPAVIEGEAGVWKFEENKAPAKIADGTYVNLVVTPDGKWIVAKKVLQSTDKYEVQMTRIRLQAGQPGREFPLNVAQLANLAPIAFIPAHNKVLVGQAFYRPGSDAAGAGYHLLDPETGALQPVKGEFRPLLGQVIRPLQPAEKPDEFWAALYDQQKKATLIGRYNARIFAFTPVTELPEIRVSSAEVWVDAAAGKVYLTYLGHLLRVPLAK